VKLTDLNLFSVRMQRAKIIIEFNSDKNTCDYVVNV